VSTTAAPAAVTKAERIRDHLRAGTTLLMPGVYDALSARLAARAGFEVIFISGYSVAATALGEPDFGLLTQTEIAAAARAVCRAAALPVIVDADTGYGNAVNVVRTVRELDAAGAAGLFLEDQVWPKRCGHMRGKRVIPLEEQLQKLRAVIDLRAEADLFVVARTDARAAVGLDEAIRRGRAFREAGADAVFIEAPQSVEELKAVAQAIPGPLVANMIEQGVTPVLGRDELRALGYQMIVWPLSGLFTAARGLEQAYAALRRAGTSAAVADRQMSFAEFNDVIGVEEKYALDARYRAPDGGEG
jgi:carboxyvinyl-carboxyphosphonate phosphorylmutase